MHGALAYRFLTNADFPSLTRLYTEVFQRPFQERELVWRFRENPRLAGRRYNYGAVVDDVVVGHTAVIPVEFACGGKTVLGAHTVGSGVKRDYPGLFKRLFTDMQAKVKQDGFDVLFGFPNPNSYPFFKRFFGFHDHYLEYLQFTAGSGDWGNERFAVEDFRRGIYNPLGEQFLAWRIWSSPVHQYQLFEHENIQVIYKRYQEREIDVIAIRFRQEQFALAALADFVRSLGSFTALNLYSTSERFSGILKRTGFVPRPLGNKLVYLMLSSNMQQEFFLQMIDNDIF